MFAARCVVTKKRSWFINTTTNTKIMPALCADFSCSFSQFYLHTETGTHTKPEAKI